MFKRVNSLLFCAALIGVLLPTMVQAQQPVEAGYRDFSYLTSGGPNNPTAEKPESKLWFNDGIWWGSLFNNSLQEYHIYRFDASDQSWTDTGTAIDPRNTSRGDALWDGQHLYIASHIYAAPGVSDTNSANWGRLYRYSYNTQTKSYSLDANFPVNITKGRSETLVLAKDSTGQLWVTWVEGGKVMVNRSTTSDLVWGEPFVLPVDQTAVSVTSDDVSSIIAFPGNKVGVMWSNQATQITYFAVHLDSSEDTVWESEEVALPGAGQTGAYSDDHINLKTDSSGRVFAATKTSLTTSTSPLVMLLVRSATGTWSNHTFGRVSDHHTRPIVLLDTEHGRLYMFASSSESGGVIYYKSTDINNIQFATGLGSLFMKSATDTIINNSTSTKQNVSSATGLLVLASDANSDRYLHNYLSLSGATNQAPVVNAGSDQTITLPSGATLNGTATDDGVPRALTTTWSKASGPGTVSFGNANALSTTATFSTEGTYVLRLTGNDGELSSTDDVTITVNPAPQTGQKSITFLEPGTDATGDFKLFSVQTGLVTSDTTVAHTGPRSFKADSGSSTATASYLRKNSVLADAGRRISFYFRYSAAPSASVNILRLLTSANSHITASAGKGAVTLTSTNNIMLYGVSGTTPLSPNTWYGVTLAYTINSTTSNQFRLYLNGALEVSRSNLTMSATGTSNFQMGWVGTTQGTGKVCNFDDIYIDDGTDLSDPGDVRVTAKLPAGDTVSTFGTAIGTTPPAGSHYTNVNQRPLSTARGWTSSAAGRSERYVLQGAAAGDVDISSFDRLGYTGWIYAKRSVAGAENMVVNGSVVAKSLTTSNALYAETVTGTSYPSSMSGIGLDASASGVSLYECGVVIAYLFNNQGQVNQAPVVNAGADQTIKLPSSATLNGSATDDGLPSGSSLTTTWTKSSGPGTVTFANASALSTTASFSESGTYVLNLNASDGEFADNDQVTVTVNPADPTSPPGQNITFLEPGTDATGDLKLFSVFTGLVSSDATVAHTGPRSYKADSGSSTATASYLRKNAVLGDAGRRISFYFRYSATPNASVNILRLLTSANSHITASAGKGAVTLTGTNNIMLYGVSGTTPLSPDTWYRVTLAYKVNSTTSNEFRLYLNGALELSRSNLTLSATGTSNFQMGWVGTTQGTAKVCSFDDIYIDDGADLSDPGDVRVTAKLPNGDTLSNFGTTVGTTRPAGSRYLNVRERPLNTANGWTSSGAGQSERYILQGAALGDEDISQFVQLGYTGWIYAKRSVAGTENMVVNGSTVPQSLTTSSAIYTQTVSGAAYPSSAAGIGLDASASGVTLYEGGALIAYLVGN